MNADKAANKPDAPPAAADEPRRLIPAPDLPYRPCDPRRYRPRIGLIGCGGITRNHLRAYRQAGYDVAALCDIDLGRARQRQEEFYPHAALYEDYRELLKRDDIEVVDAATHPAVRSPILRAAISARKHILSQKPFVLDLDEGRRLADEADARGVRLAVNQNGRWAPHFSYARQAIRAGLLGEVSGVHLSVHWDHSWVAGTEFEKIKHLILYDYAIHWFDIVRCFLEGRDALRVYASIARAPSQTVRPPLLGQALIEFEGAQASLAFDAATPYGSQDRTYVAGSRGAVSSVGPGNKQQQLTLITEAGESHPKLEGCWFPDGFHGAMAELLSSIEENRAPAISAADNLDSLALCFAAVASAETHEPKTPGTVRRLADWG